MCKFYQAVGGGNPSNERFQENLVIRKPSWVYRYDAILA
jgi:hypothetical protein